jgi:hypothetical protein
MLAKSIVSFTVLASAVLASNFFVHEDVLAHPLYSIQLGQNPISNSTAQQLLEGELAGQSDSPNPTQQLQRSMQSELAYVCIQPLPLSIQSIADPSLIHISSYRHIFS